MTGPGPRTTALLASAVILVGTLGVVLTTGVVHPPGEERLADRPLPAVDGRIAILRGPEGDRCMVVVEPATGTSRQLACGLDADRLTVAGDTLVADEWGGGAVRVDLATGAVTPTDHDGGDERCDEADVHADDGRLEARAEGGAVVLDVPAPRDYRLAEACASPDGGAAAVVDGEDRLLVVDLEDGALRTAGDDVTAAVWVAAPAAS